ncbi:MAG: phenylalanine--tRNA ligase beta subunit-related protein [Alphaproteobacteria bacterium]
MKFTIDEKIKKIGIPVYGVRISNVKNKSSDTNFNQYKLNELEKIKSQISDDFIETDNVLKGFRELHTSLGISNRKNASASENLLSFLSKRGDIPSINLLVDIYNLVSVQSKLALGAHDVSHIKNNVTLKLTDGSEKFHPISYPEPKAIASGEYAYVDEDNEVLCRLL